MPLAAGSRLGAHEIIGLLGVGGMGEVYRALDTRLNRHVAIKVLPEAYASDNDRVSRFHREAQAIAALNHASIAAIYDFAQADGIHYLVLELIEGETLADRIRRGPIPIDEALQIAKQILEALEMAHEKGICHRDLKPANIKLSSDGAVKVLDFGLAKFLQNSAAAGHLSHSPTLSLAGTFPGMIMGTAGYMSPEQAKGFEADQRSDIFSFGCILYEMLTGRLAFEGETASDILAAVLKSEVDYTCLPPRLNPRLMELLRRCLEKNPKKRWHAAADVRVELEGVQASGPLSEPLRPVAEVRRRPLWPRALALLIAAIGGAALAGAAVWQFKPEEPRRVARFSIVPPEGQGFVSAVRRFVDISPDGARIAYLASNRIYVRELATAEPREIVSETGNSLSTPVFSPDGQSLLYAVIIPGGVTHFRRIAITGGASFNICEITTPPVGVSWGDEGIVFGAPGQGILRVPANGGTPAVIAAAGPGELLGTPQLLPGGRAVLYSVKPIAVSWDRAQIAVQQLAGGERKILITGGSDARYLPTGHLVYTLSGVLLAVPFDLDTLTVVGGPVPMIEGVRRASGSALSGATQAGFAGNGTLVYSPGAVSSDTGINDLALFDRKGGNQPLKMPAAAHRAPRVSRNGKFLAYEIEDERGAAVWVYELSGASAPRALTFSGRNRAPAWSPDAQWIAFQSDREGDRAIFRQRADGSGAAERLSTPEKGIEHIPQDWSPDGERLLVTMRSDQGSSVLATLDLSNRELTPFGDARSTVLINAVFSPDGRWVAYQGRDGTTNQVFVAAFPSSGVKYLLPWPGAGHPQWSSKNEIVVNVAPQRSAIVQVTTMPTFSFGRPLEFPRIGRAEPNPATSPRAADLMPDGDRLLGILDPGQGVANELVVVLNWFEELRQRVPVP